MHTTNMAHIPAQETDAFEISPALEMEHPTSLSTYWMPLDELIAHWTERDLIPSATPVAPLLAAIGHALLALARESRALRRYTLAWEHREDTPTHETESCFNCVGRSLRATEEDTSAARRRPHRRRLHWLVYAGLGAMVALAFTCQGTYAYLLNGQAQQRIKTLLAGKPRLAALHWLRQQRGIHEASISGIPDNQLLPDDQTHLHLLIIYVSF